MRFKTWFLRFRIASDDALVDRVTSRPWLNGPTSDAWSTVLGGEVRPGQNSSRRSRHVPGVRGHAARPSVGPSPTGMSSAHRSLPSVTAPAHPGARHRHPDCDDLVTVNR